MEEGTTMKTWKPVDRYEGLYEVSSAGEIRSVDRYINTNIRHVQSRMQAGRVITQSKKKTGYMTVDLSKDGIVKTTLVHRIVANAFIPAEQGRRYVNHKDGNKSNNDVSNLEWVTSSENRIHAFETGLAIPTRSKPIMCLESNDEFRDSMKASEWIMKHYPEKTKSTRQIVAQNIRSCAKGRTPKAYGFTWKFTERSTTIPKGSTRKCVEMGDPLKKGEDIV